MLSLLACLILWNGPLVLWTGHAPADETNPSSLASRDGSVRYVLRQKPLALGDDFSVRDSAGHEVYRVDGKAISVGRRLSFKDSTGAELAFIKQKLLALTPTYEIRRTGARAAVVRKDPLGPRHRFTVHVPGADDLEARGDFLEHEYVFTRGEREVARVSKRWLSVGDTYGVEIAEGEDAVLILASVVVLDEETQRDDRERH